MNLRWIPAGNDRLLAMALGTSIVLHAVLLAVHFKFPAALRWQASEPRMEVVLVNAKTRERPSRAEVLAQANLDRGGNVDERRRARSPLPVTQPKQPGRDLAEAQRRVRELEARQQELLAMAGADRQADRRLPEAAAQEVHRRQRRRIPLRPVRGGLARQGRALGHRQLPGRGAR